MAKPKNNTPGNNGAPPIPPIPPTPETETPEVETVNLSDILAEETEVKTFVHIDDAGSTTGNTNTPPLNNGDFEKEPEPEIIDATQEQTEEKKGYKGLTAKQNAALLVGTADSLCQMILPYAYAGRYFTDEEKKLIPAMKIIHPMIKKGNLEIYNALPENEKVVYDKYVVYKEECDLIPFKDEEIELITVPLAQTFEKYGSNGMGPELTLVMGVLTVVGARIIPLFR